MKNLNISVNSKFPLSPEFVPLMPLAGIVVYPHSLTPLLVPEENSAAVELAMANNRLLAIFSELPSDEELTGEKYTMSEFPAFSAGTLRLCEVGTLCRIVKKLNFPDGTSRILVRGTHRIQFKDLAEFSGAPCVVYDRIPEAVDDPVEAEAMCKSCSRMFQEIASMTPNIPDEFRVAVMNMDAPARLSDLLADALNLSFPEKLTLLSTPSPQNRLRLLTVLMNRNIEVLQLSAKIQSEVHNAMSQAQREYYLREQLRTIQDELGEDSRNPDIVEIEKRLDETALPERVGEVVMRELSRLELLPQASPEYHVAYNYIDTLLSVPWSEMTEERLDVAEAAKVLDADHYGLKDVKERILEFLSVLQLKNDRKSPILCLVGPPGVGKTSLGQSIARAMNRKFIRMSLGGVRDEAEIRGHRRTYVGAMPGRIIQNMRKVKVANPVFMLDEIDKLGNDFRGDPASALLEVLDPQQNTAFNDHYLEIDYDLSRVFFIATANVLEAIPAPLLDRMEVIRLPGYTSFEKREIARRYLVPRQLAENGLTGRQIRFSLPAIDEIIDYYTREAGVRELERTIAQICRKLARRLVEGEMPAGKSLSVSARLVRELLGARRYLLDLAEKKLEPGVGTGMAWTSSGGVILMVETLAMPGKGNLKITGSLGKVMQESAEAAFSFIRSRAEKYGIERQVFENTDFHIHVPDGATPKDGPSAGITLSIALLSLLTRRPVRPELAMTGEITLRGHVTAIGGVKEKVIAALRAGIREVMLPEENAKDLEEVPEEVRKLLKFHFVRTFDEAAEIALEKKVDERANFKSIGSLVLITFFFVRQNRFGALIQTFSQKTAKNQISGRFPPLPSTRDVLDILLFTSA